MPGEPLLVVYRHRGELRLYRGVEFRATWACSTGALGFRAPHGAYQVLSAEENPAYTVPDVPWVPRQTRGQRYAGRRPQEPRQGWLIQLDRELSIHAARPGDPLGCFCISAQDAERLRTVPPGTVVIVT